MKTLPLVKKQLFAVCSGGVQREVSVAAWEEFGVGIQKSLAQEGFYELICLSNGYRLTDEAVSTYKEAVVWIYSLYKASQELDLHWNLSSEEYGNLPFEETTKRRSAILSSRKKALA